MAWSCHESGRMGLLWSPIGSSLLVHSSLQGHRLTYYCKLRYLRPTHKLLKMHKNCAFWTWIQWASGTCITICRHCCHSLMSMPLYFLYASSPAPMRTGHIFQINWNVKLMHMIQLILLVTEDFFCKLWLTLDLSWQQTKQGQNFLQGHHEKLELE